MRAVERMPQWTGTAALVRSASGAWSAGSLAGVAASVTALVGSGSSWCSPLIAPLKSWSCGQPRVPPRAVASVRGPAAPRRESGEDVLAGECHRSLQGEYRLAEREGLCSRAREPDRRAHRLQPRASRCRSRSPRESPYGRPPATTAASRCWRPTSMPTTRSRSPTPGRSDGWRAFVRGAVAELRRGRL